MGKKPIHVAILVRVSKKRQSPKRQVSELRAIANSRGWTVIETVVEHGISGADEERPGVERTMELAHNGDIKKVLVHEISRLGRKNSQVHKAVEDLTALKVSVYWHAQGMETLLANGKQSPAASIMLAVMAEMARNEREQLIERINSGLNEARRQGKTLGRPKGTTLSDKGLLKKHRDVVRLLKNGQSIRNVSAITRKGKSTVQRVKAAMAA